MSINTITEGLAVEEIPQDLSENEEGRKSSTKPRRHQHLRYKGVVWEGNGGGDAPLCAGKEKSRCKVIFLKRCSFQVKP